MTETLRLIMPQWQGGNNPAYSLGAKLLAWLAPAANGTPQIEVPITAYDGRHCPGGRRRWTFGTFAAVTGSYKNN